MATVIGPAVDLDGQTPAGHGQVKAELTSRDRAGVLANEVIAEIEPQSVVQSVVSRAAAGFLGSLWMRRCRRTAVSEGV